MTPDRTAAADAALSSQPPPGRPPARGRSEGGGDPFGTLLDQHQARTADAEGQKVRDSRQESSKKTQAPRKSDDDRGQRSQVAGRGSQDQKPEASDKPVDKASDAAAAQAPAVPVAAPATVVAEPAPAAVAVAVPVVTVAAAADAVSVSQVAGQAVPAVAKGPQLGLQVAPHVTAPVQLASTATPTAVAGQPQATPQAGVPAEAARAAEGAAVPALPGASKDAPEAVATKAADTQLPTPDTPAAAVTQQPKPDTTSPANAVPAQPKTPAHATTAPTQDNNPSQQNAGQQQPPQQQTQDAAAAAPAPAAPAAGAAQPAAQPAAAPAAPTAAPAQPAPQAAAPAPAAAPQAPAPGMRLQQAVETVQQVIKISQSSGITQARVQLHPEELGSIDIHLRSTPDGVVARVVADASHAAHVLRDGGDELRRQLASQGINLTHFDVGTTGQEQREASFGNQGSQQRPGRNHHPEEADTGASADPAEETTISLPNGVLVDVLA